MPKEKTLPTLELFMEELLSLLPYLRERYGVKELGVFGSYLRGEQRQDSDLDLLVDFEKDISLWNVMELEEFLSERLGVRVDLIMKSSLRFRPHTAEKILKSYVPVVENWKDIIRQKEMPKRDYRDYLRDILEMCQYLEGRSKNLSFEEFLENLELRLSFTRALEIIGEGVKNLPNELLEKYPQIEWKRVKGMRDRLAHAYFGVDYELLWRVIKEELPSLCNVVKDMLDEET
ncbi:MAG: HepT-like ribonuclease domain-containing protein [Aquificaceae bacterium]